MRAQTKERSQQTRGVLALAATALFAAGCGEDTSGLFTAEEPPETECIRDNEPRTFEVYFVIDVSGSMAPFLDDLSAELTQFAEGFPEFDSLGRRVRVDYYVVAFVNDVKWFPEGTQRMTSPIQVQQAIQEAVAAGSGERNLVDPSRNSEPEENLLDALAAVTSRQISAEAVLVMVATDAAFVESPAVLSPAIPVGATYAGVLAQLETQGIRVHAFTPAQLDGLTRTYSSQPALTSLPGSTQHRLSDLTGAPDLIRSTLFGIAQEAACN